MPPQDKLLQKIINNPNDVRFSDMCKILEWDGWMLHTQNASHYTYLKRGVGRITIVKKSDGKMKPYYVKSVLSMMGVR